MTPFRAGRTAIDPNSASPVVRDAVAHMVRQFADPLAFYRELVQNSIDAGTTSIEVRLTYESLEEDHGLVRVVVSDDGCGMDQDIIERCLLVLFRSSKEGDASKIGKFGVGFFSVFAIEPEAVLVDTGRDGVGHRVTLKPDHTYEITRISPRVGTAVTLRVPMEVAVYSDFVDRSVAALRRWCEHVSVPVNVVAQRIALDPDERRDDDVRTERIDRPFGFDSPIEVQAPGGDLRIALTVGNPAGGLFYKRGILLHETAAELVPGVRFKVESPELGHTISRDDVRRDKAFDRTVARVASLARKQLGPAIASALNAASDAYADARRAGRNTEAIAARLATVASLAGQYRLPVDLSSVRWPLCSEVAVGGVTRWNAQVSRSAFGNTPLVGRGASRLTEELARLGRSVVDVEALGSTSSEPPQVFASHVSGEYAPVEYAFVLADPVLETAWTAIETDLLGRIASLLAAVGVRHVGLAQLSGAGRARLAIAVPDWGRFNGGTACVAHETDMEKTATSFRGSRAIALHRGHDHWSAACLSAQSDPAFAALCVARAVALLEGRLSTRADGRMIHEAFDGESSS